jgi:hypothetical protein
MPEGTEAENLPDRSVVEQIEHMHAEAVKHAGSAAIYAIAAGSLLVNQKAALPHGAFQRWADAQLSLTSGTRGRYMRAWSTFQTRFPAVAERFVSESIKVRARAHFDFEAIEGITADVISTLGEAGLDASVVPSIRQLTARPSATPTAPKLRVLTESPSADPSGTEAQPAPTIPVRMPAASPVAKQDVVPNVALALSNGQALCGSIMRDINAIKSRLEQIAKDTEWLAFAEVQSIGISLDNARRAIRAATPYAPCHHCKQTGKACRVCKPTGGRKGLGWLPRNRFDMDPDKVKRAKGVK